ncbi:tumor necrosis factor receptor superfamily member 1B [Synchiropus picturatus]
MKDLLLLLVLLDGDIIKVCSSPYPPLSDGSCRNKTTEYLEQDVNRCCRRCPPGHRRVRSCTETNETKCESCPHNQYMEKWNYNLNCFVCNTCKSTKGLQLAIGCLPTQPTKCKCQPGHYCTDSVASSCRDCRKYTVCQAGSGVTKQGTANSDVKCKPCPEGSFSGIASSSHQCQPHTRCRGRVITNGNSINDTECDPEHHTETASRTVTLLNSAGLEPTITPTQELPDSTGARTTQWGTSPTYTPNTAPEETDSKFVIGSASGLFFISLLIAAIVFLLRRRKKGDHRNVSEFDANGNCESGYEISRDYSGKPELTLRSFSPPEPHLMLLNKEADQSECSGYSDARTKSFCGEESIGPLLSDLVFPNPPNTESVTSASSAEPISPQPGFPMDSSQPSSPHIISPQANSPQVNVNITVHFGNGSGGSVKATDRSDTEAPFPQEEEHISIPQQEAGKEFLLSVEEEDSPCK